MQRINTGLIGFGEWVRNSYVPTLQEIDEAAVVAVSARSEDSRRAAQNMIGSDVKLYADWRDLLADDTIDAVMIAVPNALHAQVMEQAAGSGKHLFFEPPAALDSVQIDSVLSQLAACDQVIQADLELRYLPVIKMVRKLLDKGDIGEPLLAKIRLWCNWGQDGGNWRENVEEEGLFLWLGCWYLDMLDVVFAQVPQRVDVTGGHASNGRLLDYGYALLTYANERVGVFEINLVAIADTDITLHVAATKGEVIADLLTGNCRYRCKDGPWQLIEAARTWFRGDVRIDP
jgi:predicted dehydrogenase